MEAFARRWCECNPGLFNKKSSENSPSSATASTFLRRRRNERKNDVTRRKSATYLTFSRSRWSCSIRTLSIRTPRVKCTFACHTHLRKRKTLTIYLSNRTKADYVKNTRIDGVAIELLEVSFYFYLAFIPTELILSRTSQYLYDQITLAPFVFVDEDNPAFELFDPSPTLSSSSTRLDSSTSNAAASSSGFFGSSSQKPKVDPYHLIATVSLWSSFRQHTRRVHY